MPRRAPRGALEVAHERGVTTLTLRDGDAGLVPQLHAALADAAAEIDLDDDVRLVVLRARGRAFCRGAAETRPDGVPDGVAAIASLRVPVVALVQGDALDEGLELALACDLRVAACEAKLGLPEANLGLVPAAGGTQRLTRLAGAGIAKRLILGAEVVDGGQAERLGLVQWARPRAELAAWTRALAQRIAALPREALAANKACIGAAGSPARDGYADEIAATRALYDSEETRERVARFLAARSTHSKEER